MTSADRTLAVLALGALIGCGSTGAPTTTVALPTGGPVASTTASAPRPTPAPVTFEIVEDGLPAGPMTNDALRALELSRKGRWQDAAMAWRNVASGSTGDTKENQQIAMYEEGEALYRLGLRQASYAAFSLIVDSPDFIRFRQSFQWLAQLHTELPEAADISERMKHLDAATLEKIDTPKQRPVASELRFMRGKYDYHNRNYDAAIAFFSKVDPSGPRALEARYFVVLSRLQMRDLVAAKKALGELIEHASHRPDGAAYKNLDELTLARIAFAEAATVDDKHVVTIDPKKLPAAFEHWTAVDPKSDLGETARLEMARARILAGDPTKGLALLASDESLSARMMKVVAETAACGPKVAASRAALRKDTAALRRDLRDLVGYDAADGLYADALTSKNGSGAGLSSAIFDLLKEAKQAPAIRSHLDYLALLDREQATLDRMPSSFKTSEVGGDVMDSLALSRDIERRNLDRLVEDVFDARARDLDAVLGPLSAGPTDPILAFPLTNASAAAGEHHIGWPFDTARLPTLPTCKP